MGREAGNGVVCGGVGAGDSEFAKGVFPLKGSQLPEFRLRSRYVILLLLVFPALLVLFEHFLIREIFHSDDLGYWILTRQWLRLFEEKPFWEAVRTIHSHWPGRPTFHPILGFPFLLLTNSMNTSTVVIGLLSNVASSWSLYIIFRKLGSERVRAAFFSLAISTFPFVLFIERFFFSETPFSALCFAALASLLAKRYGWLSVFFTLALLFRPLEGALLLPAFALFAVGQSQSGIGGIPKGLCYASAAILLGSALAWAGRLDQIPRWIGRVSFNLEGPSQIPLKFTGAAGAAILQSFFHTFGFTGLALIGSALFWAWSARKTAPTELVRHVGLILLLALVFFIAASFDNPATVAAYWRYSLVFVLFLLVSSVDLQARHGKGRILLAWGALFCASNVFALLSSQAESSVLDSGALGGSMQYHRSVLRKLIDRPGLVSLVAEMEKATKGGKTNILVAGRSRTFFERRVALFARCEERMGNFCGANLDGTYLNDTFKRAIAEGPVNLKQFYFGAVAFLRTPKPEDPVVGAYPNEEMVNLLEAREHAKLGLKRVDDIRLEIPGLPEALEFYLAE